MSSLHLARFAYAARVAHAISRLGLHCISSAPLSFTLRRGLYSPRRDAPCPAPCAWIARSSALNPARSSLFTGADVQQRPCSRAARGWH